MKRFTRSFLGGILVCMFILGSVSTAYAEPTPPPRADLPPRPPQSEPGAVPSLSTPDATASSLSLPPLKAVLVVGPIDGDPAYNSLHQPINWTAEEVLNMELAAAELEAHGVTVYRFYPPNTDWGSIQTAAQGAQFFAYRGHGVMWPDGTVGGFYLNNSVFVSNDDIRRGLKLAPNAITLVYGCYTAGSGNEANMDSATAQKRTVEYASPFIDIGGAGYFANWNGDAFQLFIRYLFQGKTLKQAFETYRDFTATTVETFTYPGRSDLAMLLDKDYFDNGWKYDNALIGKADKTLEDLFSRPALEVNPSAATILSDPKHSASATVLVSSTTRYGFTWHAELVRPQGAPAITLSRTSGQTGETIQVVFSPPTSGTGSYAYQLHIWTDDPQVTQPDQTVPVSLVVVKQVKTIYLPAVQR